ncbi:MAG: phosphatase PAP2 family protein [Acidimicrobiaceae bacterium]|nr:phosphatase PAP2 family protein [Acidimicrobiaceae bacterium]MYH93336.1 phosphatase PAP2 family protein [Acidimicrobiaceae bacterium]
MGDYCNAMASEVAGAGTRAGKEPAGDSSASPERSGRRSLSGSLHWWSELIIVLAFYGVYTFIRNQFGSDLGQSVKQTAIDNAYDVIAWERAVHLFGEKGIQDLFIEWDLFIQFWNIFYGFCHFAVTISVMVFLFLRHPVRYGVQRTVLAFTTGLALVGFAFYPLMPPRLLNDCSPFGACDTNYSYVDTLVDPGGFWSFNSSAMMDISNQYAAMPSLHIAWAVWCVVAALPVLRRRWVCLALLAYPWLTLFAVMVTANHYWIDAVGGLLAVAIAYPAGVLLARRLPAWLAPRPAGAVRT